MNVVRQILVALVAGTAGLFLGLSIGPAEPPPSSEPSGALVEAAPCEPCPPREVVVPQGEAEAEPSQELADCQLEARVLRGQLRVYEGEEHVWPDEVPEAFEREVLLEVLDEAWEGLATVDDLDCSEYPCLATVTLPEDQHTCCPHLMDALPQALKDQGARNYQTHALGLEDGPMRAVVTLASEQAWDDDIAVRTKWRVGLLGEQLDQWEGE